MLKTFKYYLNKGLDLILAIGLTNLILNSLNSLIKFFEDLLNK